MLHTGLILAQAGGAMDLKGILPMVLPLLAIWYFLLIRPQQKQMKDQGTLLAGLKKGDEVVTQSGLLGKIYAVADKIITLEIANGVRIRVLKTSIQSRITATEEVVALVKAEEKKEG